MGEVTAWRASRSAASAPDPAPAGASAPPSAGSGFAQLGRPRFVLERLASRMGADARRRAPQQIGSGLRSRRLQTESEIAAVDQDQHSRPQMRKQRLRLRMLGFPPTKGISAPRGCRARSRPEKRGPPRLRKRRLATPGARKPGEAGDVRRHLLSNVLGARCDLERMARTEHANPTGVPGAQPACGIPCAADRKQRGLSAQRRDAIGHCPAQ